jgi:hypothetical protein
MLRTMNAILLIAFALQLQDAVPQSSATQKIEGIVRRTADEAPMPDVSVGLYSYDGRPELNQTVWTNGSGVFMFLNVPQGQFVVRAEREGYVPPSHATRNAVGLPARDRPGSRKEFRDKVTINVGGDVPEPVALYLMPGATISGRITLESGAPVPEGTSVIVSHADYSLAGRRILSKFDDVMTNASGEYSVPILPPGQYYVSVDSDRTRGSSSFARTYYPGELSLSRARVIDTSQGGELRGIDFQVRAPGRLKISGKVINLIPGDVPNSAITFQLIPRDESVQDLNAETFLNIVHGDALKAGNFQIDGILPGAYTLFAVGYVEYESTYYVGQTQVDVVDSDIHDASIVLGKGTDIKLEMVAKDSVPATITSFALFPAEFQGVFRVPYAKQPDFTFKSVREGRYYVIPLPFGAQAGAYLADVRQDGTSVLDSGITVGHDSSLTVELEMKSGGGSIEGVVLNANKPLSYWPVYLVPAGRLRQNPAFLNSATTDAQGHFKITSLRPGPYMLLSWNDMIPAEYPDADFLSRFDALATPVEVQDGLTLTNISVKVIEVH